MILGLSPWIFWLVLAAIFIVIEAATTNLVSVWFAIGCFSAMIAAIAGADITTQVIIAAVVSIVALILIIVFKPFDKFKHRKTQATNSDRVIGKEALVVKSIDPLEGGGLVKVMGQSWSAISSDDDKIEEGEYVKVSAISGVKLIVTKINK